MSVEQNERLAQYWKEVGLLIIFDSNGSVTMGRIIDIINGSLVVKDIVGFRHWINPEAIVRIMEIERNGKEGNWEVLSLVKEEIE